MAEKSLYVEVWHKEIPLAIKDKDLKKIQVFIKVLIGVVLIGNILYSTCWAVGKRAVRKEDFGKYEDYIIVKTLSYSSTGWAIIGDDEGYFQGQKDIQIYVIGDIPPNLTSGGYDNSFLCIAALAGEKENVITDEMAKVYRISEWYPIYPVRRDKQELFDEWPGSKGYMTKRECAIKN